jgi:hypothetical protein
MGLKRAKEKGLFYLCPDLAFEAARTAEDRKRPEKGRREDIKGQELKRERYGKKKSK